MDRQAAQLMRKLVRRGYYVAVARRGPEVVVLMRDRATGETRQASAPEPELCRVLCELAAAAGVVELGER